MTNFKLLLKKAVEKGDSKTVDDLLEEECVEPKDAVDAIESCGLITQKQVEVIKVVALYPTSKCSLFKRVIFTSQCANHIALELIKYLLDYEYIENTVLVPSIFDYLMSCKDYDGPPAVKILKLLLDHGFPVNELYEVERGRETIKVTPLYHCIYNKRLDFVSKKSLFINIRNDMQMALRQFNYYFLYYL